MRGKSYAPEFKLKLVQQVEVRNLDEHGSVHQDNSSVLDEDCTKTWSDPVHLTSPDQIGRFAFCDVFLQVTHDSFPVTFGNSRTAFPHC
jgi:hypothetical protein